MNAPVDITALRNAINYDAEVEKMLLRLYIETTDAAMDAVQVSMPPPAWAEQMHLIKGAALNVGAAAMVDAAMRAQELHTASEMERQQAFEQLRAAYVQTRSYIETLAE